MTTVQYLILFGVGVYFVVGAVAAYGITALSMGFTGRFEPMAIAIFFGWPLFLLLKTMDRFVLILPWLGAAGFMVWLVYWFVIR